jgi:2-aminoethylphosphonate-pyruvate transaminase
MSLRHASYLLTPGPVTVSDQVKKQMMFDRSANSAVVIEMTKFIRSYLLEICNGTKDYECVPLQGSATYAVEAAFQTLVPRGSGVLVIENGHYGARMSMLAEAVGMRVQRLDFPLYPLPTAAEVEAALEADPSLEYVGICHVETSTGALNPIEEIAAVARRMGRKIIVDAVASFGGIPIDLASLDAEALIISPNKCLEAVPGVGIVIAKRDLLEQSQGRSSSPCLDLYDQWKFLDANGFFRWTPPTHVLGALGEALKMHKEEGGVGPRHARYKGHWERLVNAMRQRGFTTLLPDEANAPIVTSFYDLKHPKFSFEALFASLEKRSIIIFPGRFPAQGTFRIGVMGDLVTEDIDLIIHSIDEALEEMGIQTGADQ